MNDLSILREPGLTSTSIPCTGARYRPYFPVIESDVITFPSKATATFAPAPASYSLPLLLNYDSVGGGGCKELQVTDSLLSLIRHLMLLSRGNE